MGTGKGKMKLGEKTLFSAPTHLLCVCVCVLFAKNGAPSHGTERNGSDRRRRQDVWLAFDIWGNPYSLQTNFQIHQFRTRAHTIAVCVCVFGRVRFGVENLPQQKGHPRARACGPFANASFQLARRSRSRTHRENEKNTGMLRCQWN